MLPRTQGKLGKRLYLKQKKKEKNVSPGIIGLYACSVKSLPLLKPSNTNEYVSNQDGMYVPGLNLQMKRIAKDASGVSNYVDLFSQFFYLLFLLRI